MTVYEFLKTIKLQDEENKEEPENQKTTNQSNEQKDLETITVYDDGGERATMKMGAEKVYGRSDNYGEENHTEYSESYSEKDGMLSLHEYLKQMEWL